MNAEEDILIATDESRGMAEYQEEEIKILGVEEVIVEEGHAMTVVSVEVEGEPALLIDMNHDDVINVTVADTDFPYTHHDNLPDYTHDVDPYTII